MGILRRLSGDIFGQGKHADPTQASNQLAAISQRVLDEAAPLKNALMSRYLNFAESGFDPAQLPQYGSLKNSVDQQYGRARENILSSTPSGGGLISALSNLEGQRAGSLATGLGGLADNEMARALGLATGQQPAALGGLSSAAQSQGNIALAQSQQAAGNAQAIGGALGSYFGSKN